jgi:hypothetical protein
MLIETRCFTPLMLGDFKRSITANPCASTQTRRALPELELSSFLGFNRVEHQVSPDSIFLFCQKPQNSRILREIRCPYFLWLVQV